MVNGDFCLIEYSERVLISPRILVDERRFKVRSRARDEASRMIPLRVMLRVMPKGAARAAVVEVVPDTSPK